MVCCLSVRLLSVDVKKAKSGSWVELGSIDVRNVAVTRAKRNVWIIGDMETLYHGQSKGSGAAWGGGGGCAPDAVQPSRYNVFQAMLGETCWNLLGCVHGSSLPAPELSHHSRQSQQSHQIRQPRLTFCGRSCRELSGRTLVHKCGKRLSLFRLVRRHRHTISEI